MTKKILRFILAAALLTAVAVLIGTVLPRPLWHSADPAPVATRHILVLTNPIHTDIAIPIDAGIRRKFSFLGQAGMPIDVPGARYLVFGWGGRAFYIGTPTWADLKFGPLMQGLTLDRSVMHVDVVGDILEPHPAVSGHDIGEAEFQRMVRFILASFQHSPDGPMQIPDISYGEYDRFYEANGYFTAILGCNTWAAKALRAAGLQTGWWNPLPVTLAYSLWLHN